MDGFKHKGFYFPISFKEGPQYFEDLADLAAPETEKDYKDIISRYKHFPKYADQNVAMMRTALSQKLTNHNASMEGVVKKLKKHLNGTVEDSAFFKPFQNIMTLSPEVIEKLQKSAKDAIHGVRGGMALLAVFIQDEYMPASRKDVGVSSLPGGEQFYQECIRFHTSTNLTSKTIYDTGDKEVANLEKEIEKIIQELEFDLSVKDFNKQMQDNNTNHYETSAEMRDAFTATIKAKIGPKIKDIFYNETRGELEIKVNPNEKSALYTAGTLDGNRPSVLKLAPVKEKSLPKFITTALSLHEANPGHHYQAMYMQAQKGVPEFRKVFEDRIYSQSPSRFPLNTAYVEGWGLYSETLGYDLGLYTDTMDRYGQLSENLLRACRLVVDTGIHAFKWTKEKAVKYMQQHIPYTKKSIEAEVDRYITWPGQALSYKIGQLEITKLRERAENKLGEDFDIKDFHEVVLKAYGPLTLLDKKVKKYIKSTQARRK